MVLTPFVISEGPSCGGCCTDDRASWIISMTVYSNGLPKTCWICGCKFMGKLSLQLWWFAGFIGIVFFQCCQWLVNVPPRIQNIPRKGISCYDFPNMKKCGREKHHKNESWLKRRFQKKMDNRLLWKMKFPQTPYLQNLHPKKGKRLLIFSWVHHF